MVELYSEASLFEIDTRVATKNNTICALKNARHSYLAFLNLLKLGLAYLRRRRIPLAPSAKAASATNVAGSGID